MDRVEEPLTVEKFVSSAQERASRLTVRKWMAAAAAIAPSRAPRHRSVGGVVARPARVLRDVAPFMISALDFELSAT